MLRHLSALDSLFVHVAFNTPFYNKLQDFVTFSFQQI